MTSTQNKLLNAISDGIWHNTFSSIPTDVLEEAQLQAVAGLLEGEDLYTATKFVQYCYVEDELVELLSSHSIPSVILKGASAARGFKLKDDIGRGSARADLLRKLGIA